MAIDYSSPNQPSASTSPKKSKSILQKLVIYFGSTILLFGYIIVAGFPGAKGGYLTELAVQYPVASVIAAVFMAFAIITVASWQSSGLPQFSLVNSARRIDNMSPSAKLFWRVALLVVTMSIIWLISILYQWQQIVMPFNCTETFCESDHEILGGILVTAYSFILAPLALVCIIVLIGSFRAIRGRA
jgi:hypothetical protein